MKLHEYQSKELFKRFGIPVPQGVVVTDTEDLQSIRESLKGPPWVAKAQVHAGGRGKGGGIKLTNSLEELKHAVEDILTKPLVTPQTGPEGKKVNKVLIEEGVDIEKELYVGLTIDRSKASPVMIFSPEGGMEIEEVAKKSPNMVWKEHIDPSTGWQAFHGRNLVYRFDPLPDKSVISQLISIMERLYRLFIELDCSLAEINPLVITKQSGAMALDAKINIDDNALFRQKELKSLDDPDEKDPLEQKASLYNLNYIKLDGNIGAMVNGAGLAMATMDLIKASGGEPANFLDVGGGASEEMITRGFEIILSDPKVEAILVNIFGGILRCDVLARGLVSAAKKMEIKVPLIIRLEGTNVDEGRRILSESGLSFLVAKDMEESARLVSEQVKK